MSECKYCGKSLESGRKFCGPSCQMKCQNNFGDLEKRSNAAKRGHVTRKSKKDKLIEEYFKNPKKCSNCGKVLEYGQRTQKYCSRACSNIIRELSTETKAKISETLVQTRGNTHNNPSFHCGRYKGVWCDSSWELAFIVYHIDKGISFERNTKIFKYFYDGVERSYTPDFIVNGKYIEIKGLERLVDSYKWKVVDNLQVLYKDDMKMYLDYAKETYGERFWEVLYSKKLYSKNSQ